MKHKHTIYYGRKGERKALTFTGVIFLLIALSVFLFPMASAEEFGYNYLEPGTNLQRGTNFSKIEVNYSNFTDAWLTNIGTLQNVHSPQLSNGGGVLNLVVSWDNSR